MRFIERDLETLIFETDNEKLNERGLLIEGKKKRQIFIGNYGKCDLVTLTRRPLPFSFSIDIEIFELKLELITRDSVFQLLRYAQGIRHYLDKRGFLENCELNFNYTIIAKSININDPLIFMPDHFRIKFYTFDYKFDGIYFKRIYDYFLINPGF
jgi:hypothetical protein